MPYRGHVSEVYLPICGGDITPCLMSQEGSGLEGVLKLVRWQMMHLRVIWLSRVLSSGEREKKDCKKWIKDWGLGWNRSCKKRKRDSLSWEQRVSCDKAKTARADGSLSHASSDRATDQATLSALLLALVMGEMSQGSQP